jgi:hypothetical protein
MGLFCDFFSGGLGGGSATLRTAAGGEIVAAGPRLW